MPEGRVAAVILAAGASTRLGEPKQLVTLGGERLLERAVRVAREAGCVPVVVLGCGAEAIEDACELDGVQSMRNSSWEEGMGSSVRAGVAAVRDWAAGLLLMTCDQPAVTGQHLRELMQGGDLAASSYAGKRGVPAYFPVSSLPLLLALEGDAGARGLLASARLVALCGGELDVDTVESLVDARKVFGGSAD